MLLTSPGDSSSSLPINSLSNDASPPPDSTLNAQSGIEGDRVTVSTDATAESDRTQLKHKGELDGLYALRQAGGLKALRRSRTSLWSTETLAKLAESDLIGNAVSFAAPLSPLRERDLKALDEFFLRDDIYAIEADIKQRLLLLLPEPCWEEDVFDFLKDFL